MTYQAFLIKYSEIGVKGKNRYIFEDALVRQIKRSLYPVEGNFIVKKQSGRIFISVEGEYDYDEAVDALQHVFGISAICPTVVVPDEGFDSLEAAAYDYLSFDYTNDYDNDNNNINLKTKNYGKSVGRTLLQRVA